MVTAAGIAPGDTSRADLARRMVGREILEVLERTPFAPGPVVLSVRDVSAENDRGLPALRGVSMDVRAGEIVGIAAVAGNGQNELAEVITGAPARSWQRHDRRDRGRQPAGRPGDPRRASPTSPRIGPASAAPRTCRSPTT